MANFNILTKGKKVIFTNIETNEKLEFFAMTPNPSLFHAYMYKKEGKGARHTPPLPLSLMNTSPPPL